MQAHPIALRAGRALALLGAVALVLFLVYRIELPGRPAEAVAPGSSDSSGSSHSAPPKTPAASPASGRSERTPEAVDEGARVRFVDSSGAPVAQASVRLRRLPAGELREEVAGPDGLRLAAGRYALEVRAPFRVGRLGVAPFRTDREIELPPAGELEIRGAPRQPELRVTLLPQAPWEEDVARSDRDRAALSGGEAPEEDGLHELLPARGPVPFFEGARLWEGLPPGTYRYRIEGGPVHAQPPHESRPVEFLPDGTMIDKTVGLAPRGLSGELVVKAGERTVVDLAAAGRLASLSGCVAVRRGNARVLLRRIEQRESAAGDQRATTALRDAGRALDQDGCFLIEGLEPGALGLLARDTDGTTHTFYQHEVELAHGEHRDLGVLAPLPTRVEVDVRFRSPEGTLLPAGEVFEGGEPRVELQLFSSGGRAPWAAVNELFRWRPGDGLVLEGLAPGTYHLRARLPAEELGRLAAPWHLLEPRLSRHEDLADVARWELGFDLVYATLLSVSVSGPRGRALVMQASLIPAEEGDPLPLRLSREADGEWAGQASLLPGVYGVVVQAGDDGRGWFARGEVTVGGQPEQQLALALDEGAVLRGRLLDLGDEPRVAETLRFAPADTRPFRWIYWAMTDEQGGFELVGLEPGRPLACEGLPGLFEPATGEPEVQVLRR